MQYENENRNDLIISYLPLVKQVVGRIDGKNSGYDFDDLVNIGVMGLMDALEKFDETKKVPFEAYARIRINGSVMDELRRSGPVSRNRMEKLNEYYKAKSGLENSLMRTPTEIEIQEELGIMDREISSIYETLHYLSNTSLETVFFTSEGNGIELKDMLEDENAELPEKIYLIEEMKELLVSSIDKLNERLKTILNLYYVEELSMKEISYIMDISIPRVSQLHGKALEELRVIMTKKVIV